MLLGRRAAMRELLNSLGYAPSTPSSSASFPRTREGRGSVAAAHQHDLFRQQAALEESLFRKIPEAAWLVPNSTEEAALLVTVHVTGRVRPGSKMGNGFMDRKPTQFAFVCPCGKDWDKPGTELLLTLRFPPIQRLTS